MRERTTWNRNEIQQRQAATTRTADPYAMNQDHKQPGADQYLTGDPSAFAEDIATPNWKVEYSGGAMRRDEIGLAEMRSDTFNHPEKTAALNPDTVVKKAELVVKLARRMLGNEAPEAVVEDQAVALMHMPDAEVINTYNRLAGEQPPWLKKDDKDEKKEEEAAQEQAKQAMAAGDYKGAMATLAKLAAKKKGNDPLMQQSGQQQEQQAGQQQQAQGQQQAPAQQEQQAGQQQQAQGQGQQQVPAQQGQQAGQQQQSAWYDSHAGQQQQQAQAQDVEAQVEQMIQEAMKQANQGQQQGQGMQQQAPAQQQAGQQQQSGQQQGCGPMQQQSQGQPQQGQPQQGQPMQQQGQQQQAPVQQQATQQQVQASDDALLDQMLMPGGGAGAAPGTAEVEIQMDTPSMDIGDINFAPGEDEMLRQLFATGDEAQAAQQAQQAQQEQGQQGQGQVQANVRTAALRTVGTRPTAGVARIGGSGAPPARGQDVNQLSGLWQSAPDVREAFGLKT